MILLILSLKKTYFLKVSRVLSIVVNAHFKKESKFKFYYEIQIQDLTQKFKSLQSSLEYFGSRNVWQVFAKDVFLMYVQVYPVTSLLKSSEHILSKSNLASANIHGD
jgi:hypothetical protein